MASDELLQTNSVTMPAAEEMADEEFWRRLLPEFSITEQPIQSERHGIHFSDVEADRLSRQVRKEGYFQSDPIIPTQELEPLAQAISTLDQARILPLFIAIYDEFWRFLQNFTETFNPILGESYMLTADFWAWHITPNDSGRGWHLHRDSVLTKRFDENARIREDWSPRLCTIWIPLTDANTHNSCIYVLPFPHDPAIQSFMRKENPAEIQRQAQFTNWSNVRALPAKAGSVLGWTPYIAHWGSQSTEWATHPRVSIAIYSEAADAPLGDRPPQLEMLRHINLHDRGLRIGFEDRLKVIANIISVYIDNGQMNTEPNYSPAVNEFCRRWKYQGN